LEVGLKQQHAAHSGENMDGIQAAIEKKIEHAVGA